MDREAWWATVHEVTKSQTLNNSMHVRWEGVWDGGGTCTAMEEGGFWVGGIHVHAWLIHVNVWQKLPQCCKVISLQLK